MALSYKNDDKQDERLDPSIRNTHNDSAQKLNDLENDAFNDIADNYDKDANDSTEESNIKKIGDREDSPSSGWQNNTTGKSSSSTKVGNKLKALFTVKGLKKTGPVGLLITIILGGGAGLLILTTPALMLQQLKETMLGKFNDRMTVMELRTRVVLKNKLSNQTKGICTTAVSVRCKMASMSNRQISRFEKAGITVNKRPGIAIPGRSQIASFTFEGQTIDGNNLQSFARSNPRFASALSRGYNPRLYTFSDGVAAKFHQKYGVNRAKNISGTTDEQNKENLKKNVSGQAAAEVRAGVTRTDEACNGGEGCVDGNRTTYTDSSGQPLDPATGERALSGAQELTTAIDAKKLGEEAAATAAKNTAKSFLLSTAFGLGAIDSACGGYNLIRTVGSAAKSIQKTQLLRYAHIFPNTADTVRAGDATAEQINYVSNLLTQPNSDGKSFSDSYGYKYMAYGDVPTMQRGGEDIGSVSTSNGGVTAQLTDAQADKILVQQETSRYINGQLVANNVVASLINFINSGKANVAATAAAADETCGFVLSGTGQTILIGGAVLGAVAAFFTGGATALAGAIPGVAVSVVIGAAVGALIPKVTDLAAGTIITGDENGNEAGNGLTSGMGGYGDLIAQAGGITALRVKDAVAFQKDKDDVNAYFAMIDRQDLSPFDASSKNTWLGRVAFAVIPYTSKMASIKNLSLPTAIKAVSGLTTGTFASIIPKTNAANITDQYYICDDIDYTAENLAADPFCNLRRGLSTEAQSIQPDDAVVYMTQNNYIDPESGQPSDDSNEYANWIKNCVDRDAPINSITETNNDAGLDCIANNQPTPAEQLKYNTFSVYFIDQSVEDGMTNGPQSSAPATDAGATGTSNESGTLVDGDTKTLARQLLDSKNVQFQVPAQRSAMEYIAQTGKGRACGAPAVSPNLLRVLVTASQKYKITIGVIVDGHSCNSGQHPKGLAVDINGIAHLDQPFMNRIELGFIPSQIPILKEFSEYIDTLSAPTGEPGGIRFGQSQCWRGNPPNMKNIKTAQYWYPDTCHHIHMGVNP